MSQNDGAIGINISTPDGKAKMEQAKQTLADQMAELAAWRDRDPEGFAAQVAREQAALPPVPDWFLPQVPRSPFA